MSEPSKATPRAHILVVEDSSVFREMQGLLLGQAGFAVSLHEFPQAALEESAKQHFDLVVIDYELPEMNGQQFMLALRQIQPDVAVIFVSGSLTLELAVQLSSQGVAGIFNKPANPKTLLEKINETLARNAVRDTAARVGSGSPLATRRGTSSAPFATATPASSTPVAGQLAYQPRFVLGNSEFFRDFTHRLWKVRDFRAVLLLQGEPGSAFELLARDLAEISVFRDGPIMVCDAVKFEPLRLIEVLAPSLLSHDAGTLVVTGVEAFTAEQQKTLQNLMTGRDVFLPFARRFRLVLAATNKLSERVDDGSFGETLFYKISSLSLAVPSLREMRGDIAANAARILEQLGESGNAAVPVAFTPEAAEWIDAQDWPGNYDQLYRTLQMAVGYAHGPDLTVAALEGGLHHEDDFVAAVPRVPVPVALPDTGEHEVGETRPPFPLASDLASETVAVASKLPAPNGASAAPAPVSTNGSAKPVTAPPPPTTAPARALTAQSLFRPAARSYNFSQRLADSLATADAVGAS